MSKEEETILGIGDKCKITVDSDGIIRTKGCPDLEFDNLSIDMFTKVKDIVKEDEV